MMSLETAAASRLANLWAGMPVGTPVLMRRTGGQAPSKCLTSSGPWLQAGHAVIGLAGITRPVCLSLISLAGPAQPVVLAPAAAPAAQSPALPDVDPVSSAGAVMLLAVSALTVIVGLKTLLTVVLGGGL